MPLSLRPLPKGLKIVPLSLGLLCVLRGPRAWWLSLAQEKGRGLVFPGTQVPGQAHPTTGPLPCRTIKVEVYDWDRDGR